MASNYSFFFDIGGGITLDESNGTASSWVHALPLGTYKHPIFGTIAIDAARAKRFSDSVVNRVRGIDPSINYDHNNSAAASGWVKNAQDRVDGVWLYVEWTADAVTAIKEKKYRYFSAEFNEEWEDSQGVKHSDVIIGGALTNRPFMKNLVPVNLSEQTYETAFELVSAISGTSVEDLKGGKNVGLEEADITKIVDGLATKLAEKKIEQPNPVVSLTDIPELKELAEQNPMVKLLIQHVETQKLALATNAEELKRADVTAKLNDFDRSKIVLTPVARKLAEELMIQLPAELTEKFWSLITEMKKGSSFLVELGERAGATVNYGSQKSALQQLQEIAKGFKRDQTDLSEVDAFDRACAENPKLYARYRTEQLEGVSN